MICTDNKEKKTSIMFELPNQIKEQFHILCVRQKVSMSTKLRQLICAEIKKPTPTTDEEEK